MWNDLRLAARVLARERRFAIAAAAALAIGMSATITMFTIVNGALLRDLPFSYPDRIVAIGTRYPKAGQQAIDNMSLPDLRDLQASARLFDGIGAADEGSMDLADETHAAERFVGAWVSANAFSLIGHTPVLGRGFTPADERPGAQPVVILGYDVWARRYAAAPGIVGTLVRVNGVASTVIGVMPRGFGFPTRSELWLPMEPRSDDGRQQRGVRNVDAFGRMAEGVTMAQAERDLAGVMQRLASEFPETNANVVPVLRPFRDVTTSGPIRVVFLGLMAMAAFLLLISCANVANLLLARGAFRVREIAVRLSLGARSHHVVRQLLAESLLLAAVAGTAGVVLAAFGVRVFQGSIAATGAPYWIQFPIDASVFAFVVGISVATTIACGLAPALHTAKNGLTPVLNDAGRGIEGSARASRWMDAFVVLQLTLGLTMLAGAGLMVRSVYAFSRIDIGVDTTGLVAARLNLPEQKYRTNEHRRAFYRRLEERLASMPGVRAGLASQAPLRGAAVRRVSTDGRAPSREDPAVSTVAIGPGYLEALGVGAVEGRLFTAADEPAADRIAIVNERFAAMRFPNGNAVGRTIRFEPAGNAAAAGDPLIILGVVPNIRQASPRQDVANARAEEPVVYVPFAAAASPFGTIVARSGTVQIAAIASALRDAIAAVDRDLPLLDILPFSEAMEQELGVLKVFSGMFSLFATAAVALVAIGLYAVTSYVAAQRTRELGLRLALGARRRHVWWVVTRRGLVALLVGLAIGLAGALGVGALLQYVPGVDARDPITLIGVPVLMALVTLVACLGPAIRAMRLDPSAALRAE